MTTEEATGTGNLVGLLPEGAGGGVRDVLGTDGGRGAGEGASPSPPKLTRRNGIFLW